MQRTVTLPYKILIGEDMMSRCDSLLKESKLGSSATLFCSGNIMNIVGDSFVDSVSLDVDVVSPESMEKSHVEKSANRVKTDFIIGMGGGRTIDYAKYVSKLTSKPWVAFPTILSHDGVVSSRAVLKDRGAKISLEAAEPSAIIADTGVIKNAPYRYLAAGAGDLISNISSVNDWKLADKAGEEPVHSIMARLAMLSAEAVMEHADEIRRKTAHGMEILLWSLISSGFAMNIYGSSRPCSGSEHNFSHALEEMGVGALHGEQCALGTIATVYLQKGDWKNVRRMVKGLGLPLTAEEIGLSDDDIVKALSNAKNVRDRYTVLDEAGLDEEKSRKVLEIVGII